FRFAYEEVGWSGEAPPLATEIVIEARSGDTCTVRMVHSLFTSRDDWDKEIEGMENGWPPFFRILRIYLGSFSGMRAASARPTVTFAGSQDAAWRAVRSALGLAGAAAGEKRDVAASGGPRLAGTVEDVRETARDRAVTLRLEAPAPGAAMIGTYEWAGKVNVAVSLFFYGDDADAVLAREAPRWEAWMRSL
ncbi:hypothetical protein, partial [Arenibaculum sp.]|uniref:hypothetical protein n=1 Tax=Arenibaculum sp. TaxID=2865862 RepID=UPI002E1580D7|nr:hypothetical protein [Arenibaculum sp.]